MAGGTGADRFTFQDALAAGNADHVVDFRDRRRQDPARECHLRQPRRRAAAGQRVRVGTAAADASDRIIYDSATGNLYFDSDGSGATAALLFATLDNAPATLAASDFLVI